MNNSESMDLIRDKLNSLSTHRRWLNYPCTLVSFVMLINAYYMNLSVALFMVIFALNCIALYLNAFATDKLIDMLRSLEEYELARDKISESND